MRPGYQERQKTSNGGHDQIRQVQAGPFGRAERCVDDHKYEKYGERHNEEKARLSSLLAFVFTLPIDVISAGQLNLCPDLLNRFFDGAAEVAAPHTILDGNVPLISFAVNFRAAVRNFDL